MVVLHFYVFNILQVHLERQSQVELCPVALELAHLERNQLEISI